MNKEDAQKIQEASFQRYRNVFSTPEGRMVLEDMMNLFHVKGLAKGIDPYDTYFRDGQRSVVMHILGHLSMNIKDYRKLITQNEGAGDEF